MELQADEEDFKMLSELGAWMAELVAEAKQTHFEDSKGTLDQYTSGCDNRLEELMKEPVSAMGRFVVPTENLE